MSRESSGQIVPWITKNGCLDPGKFPIEGVLQQALEADPRAFHSGVKMLEMMYGHGRKEAGVFLLGLLAASDDEWERREIIVDALGQVRTAACARLLFAELRRVESSNTTRRYLNAVIERLAAMSPELVDDGFDALAHDPSFSYRMRSKFKEALSRGQDFPTEWR